MVTKMERGEAVRQEVELPKAKSLRSKIHSSRAEEVGTLARESIKLRQLFGIRRKS